MIFYDKVFNVADFIGLLLFAIIILAGKVSLFKKKDIPAESCLRLSRIKKKEKKNSSYSVYNLLYLFQGDCFRGTFLHASSAISTAFWVNVSDIVHRDSFSRAYVHTGAATDTIFLVNYCWHFVYLLEIESQNGKKGFKCFVIFDRETF
jgi:hypothetical protein